MMTRVLVELDADARRSWYNASSQTFSAPPPSPSSISLIGALNNNIFGFVAERNEYGLQHPKNAQDRRENHRWSCCKKSNSIMILLEIFSAHLLRLVCIFCAEWNCCVLSGSSRESNHNRRQDGGQGAMTSCCQNKNNSAVNRAYRTSFSNVF